MPKVITSPVARYPGAVVLHDPLTFPQYMAWEDAVSAGAALTTTSYTHYSAALLPGVCACVEDWQIKGLPEPVTPETFPATPRKASDALLSWLVTEITQLVTEADEPDPK
jgi:hypothetical protein